MTKKENKQNEIVIKNVKVADMYATTKFGDTITIQTDAIFKGYDERGIETNTKSNFTIAPLRFVKECSNFDENSYYLYPLMDKRYSTSALCSCIKYILRNATIDIIRTFIPKGAEEGRDDDHWNTKIISCCNTKDFFKVYPIIKDILDKDISRGGRQTTILNTFNI